MATIRKRAQKWQVLIRRKGRPAQCRSFLKRADAEAWARSIESEMDRAAPFPAQPVPGNLTVGYIITRYRDEIVIRKAARDVETCILNAFLRHRIAAASLAAVTPGDFYAYRYERLEKVNPGTVNREMSIIRHAFEVAIHEWSIPLRENPLKRMKKMKTQDGRTRRLEPGELQHLENFFSGIRNPYLVPLIHFAIETAMRRVEILNMAWQDINFKKNTLHIPVTKNGYSRTIPLTDKAIDILQNLPKNHDRIFFTTANAVKMAWQRLVERTGIDDLHFHDLRHEAISRLFEKGLSVPEVALISGHRDYRMLFRYTHLKPEDLAKKLRQL